MTKSSSSEWEPASQRMPEDLFLVRHGRSEGNVARDLAKGGDTSLLDAEYLARSAADYRLVRDGVEQARLAGAWLRAWMSTVGADGFDRYYCSPYARTRETAAHLGIDGAGWQLEPLLRERDYGLWEGRARDDTAAAFPRSATLKERNKFLWRPECGESTADVDMRVREMLATFARELSGRRVLCVTHEDVMWAFRFRLEKLTIEEWLDQEDDDAHAVTNGAVLHYTRRAEDGVLGDKFVRVRLVDPADHDGDHTSGWRTIERRRFTNDELLAQVDAAIGHLWGGRHA
jgi:NAD+ kinase